MADSTTELEVGLLEAPVVKDETLATPVQAPAQTPARRGWIGPILGGIIAAAAGYGLAKWQPNGWPLQDTSALQTALAEQQNLTESLKAEVANLAEKPAIAATDPALLDRIAALEAAKPADPAPLERRLADLEARLLAVESVPVGSTATPEVLAAQKAAADKVLQQAEAEAAQIKADAGAAAKAAEARAALGQLQAALESGAPYEATLAALGSVPAILTDNAKTGLPTLAALQSGFPTVARAALDAALRANMGQGWSDRVATFLRTQTGARSLTPREGNDPDAILSRAEAALAVGDLTKTLSELATMPVESQADLAAWQADATKRQAAVDAVAALAIVMK